MSAKKQIIIVSMVFIVVAVGLIFIIGGKGGSSVEKSLEEAKAYYDMYDYDNAIAIYNNLLNTEKSCADAYIGLADTYIVKGNADKAMEILERGLENSDDPRIAEMIDELSAEYTEAENVPETTDISSETDITDIIPEENESDTSAIIGSETIPTETAVPETTVSETAAPETTVPPVAETTTPAPVVTAAPRTTSAAPITTTSVTTAKPTIEVPNFIEMDKDEAVKLAKSLKINLNVEFDKNDTYANNVIYYQSHRAGTMVSEKEQVDVFVCVNDQKRLSEDDVNLNNFFEAIQTWGNNNSDKVKSVTLNEKNSVVTISASSLKKFVIDESVAAAFAECKNASLVINSSTLSIVINSGSVSGTGKMDLSADTFGNASRVTLDMRAAGNLNCTASVTISDCSIDSDSLKEMTLFVNNKKSGSFSVNSNGKPVITVSSGGQYIIH